MSGNGQGGALSPEAQLREDQRREALRREQEAAQSEMQHEPVQHEPVQQEQPPQEAAHVPVEAAPRQVEAPRVDPKVLLESAGLVMIETDRSKAPPITGTEEEPQHLGRPRRERAKPAAQQEEELVQIETSRKQAS